MRFSYPPRQVQLWPQAENVLNPESLWVFENGNVNAKILVAIQFKEVYTKGCSDVCPLFELTLLHLRHLGSLSLLWLESPWKTELWLVKSGLISIRLAMEAGGSEAQLALIKVVPLVKWMHLFQIDAIPVPPEDLRLFKSVPLRCWFFWKVHARRRFRKRCFSLFLPLDDDGQSDICPDEQEETLGTQF